MSYLERFWDYLYKDLYGEDEFQFVVFGTAAIQGVLFWGLSALFILVDLTERPKWMLRFKTQLGANEPLDRAKLWKAVKGAVFNQVFVSSPYLVFLYYGHRYMGSSCRTEDLPSLITIVRDFIFFYIQEEITFYYLHRLFHWGPLYKRFHKMHHEWTAPACGVVSIYAHPVEYLFVNMTQFAAGPLLMGSHRFTTLLWYIRSIITTIIHHSGYHLPIFTSSEFHDFHHLKFNCNYGSTIMVLDWLHRTDKQFRDTVQEKRHYISYKSTPMAERHPNTKHKKATKAG